MSSKYKAVKSECDGMVFDSQKERKRYLELRCMEEEGTISHLELQKKYELIPSQVLPSPIQQRRGKKKYTERGVFYVADFVYKNSKGETIVEDVKGYKKGQAYSIFSIKRKLMLHRYGIQVWEV